MVSSKKTVTFYFLLLSFKIFGGFASGTLVKVVNGYRPIEELQPGDCVYSLTRSGNCSLSRVKRVTSYFLPYGITISVHDHHICVAPRQKIYNSLQNTWCKAKHVYQSMPLLSGYKDVVYIDDVQTVDREFEYFDIRLEKDHTFFVSKADIVVHNFPPFFIGFSIVWGGGLSFEGLYAGLCIAGYWLGTKLLRNGGDNKKWSATSLHDNNNEISREDKAVLDHCAGDYSNDIASCYISETENELTIESEAYWHQKESMKDIQQRLLREKQAVSADGAPDPDDDEFEKKHPHGMYEGNPKHHQNSKGNVSKPPRDGQAALDNSIEVESKDCRVAIQDNQIVMLQQHRPGMYHGYIERNFYNLDPEVQRALRLAGRVINPKMGKIK